ncbi:MAG: ABC transporter ATP-binding protein [Caldilineales bacterium]|nr:ABC transporter ATP-binding protein [Caldilineales bacterium]MDW8317255.1 ABC transporter ATP-binding protein [Anaerolineae bacterium]
MAFEPVLETIDLHKHFGKIHAVNGVTLSINSGEIYGLIGPNGSGKTTLIRLCLGLLRPTAGTVRIFGKAIPNKMILSDVGYMPQAGALYEELTVRENVAFFAEMCGSHEPAWIDEAIALVGLQDRARSLVRTLSGGMRQRTSLACSLAHRPRLLLLDEPTVGVDPQLRATFWSYFRRLAVSGVTLIVSSHVMDEAERCDRLGLMRQGRLLAEGTPGELRKQKNANTLEEAFLRFIEDDSERGTR